MDDLDYEAIARGVRLIERACTVVRDRKYSGRPGSEWFIWEFGLGSSSTGTPSCNGIHAVARMYASDDGNRYQVIVYTFDGKEMERKEYKTLDPALRYGKRAADTAR